VLGLLNWSFVYGACWDWVIGSWGFPYNLRSDSGRRLACEPGSRTDQHHQEVTEMIANGRETPDLIEYVVGDPKSRSVADQENQSSVRPCARLQGLLRQSRLLAGPTASSMRRDFASPPRIGVPVRRKTDVTKSANSNRADAVPETTRRQSNLQIGSVAREHHAKTPARPPCQPT